MIFLATAALFVSLVPASPGLVVDESGAAVSETESMARSYLQACFEERDLDAAFALLAEDVEFADPTAEVFGGPAYYGVHGRDKFRQLTESWGLESSHFEVEHCFFSGEYAVFAGKLSWQGKGAAPVEGVPFCTVLRVQDGGITERMDYGDYDEVFGRGGTAIVDEANGYFDAYEQLDLEAIASRFADDVQLDSPIAGSAGGVGRIRGKVDSLRRFEESKAVARGLSIDVQQSFFSGTHAFYYGVAKYRILTGGKEIALEHPCAHVVRIEDGEVTLHRRYLDHDSIERQIAAAVAADEGN